MFENSINKAFILGRMGNDPVLKYTSNGTPMLIISLATNDSVKTKDNNFIKKTEWHKIVLYSNLAENVANFTTKGSLLFVEGSIKTNTWTHENEKKITKDIIASNVQIIDKKNKKDIDENKNITDEFSTFDDKTPF